MASPAYNRKCRYVGSHARYSIALYMSRVHSLHIHVVETHNSQCGDDYSASYIHNIHGTLQRTARSLYIKPAATAQNLLQLIARMPYNKCICVCETECELI